MSSKLKNKNTWAAFLQNSRVCSSELIQEAGMSIPSAASANILNDWRQRALTIFHLYATIKRPSRSKQSRPAVNTVTFACSLDIQRATQREWLQRTDGSSPRGKSQQSELIRSSRPRFCRTELLRVSAHACFTHSLKRKCQQLTSLLSVIQGFTVDA